LGFVVADRVGGGPPEGSLSAVVEVDGDRVFGDVDGELSVGVGSAEGQFLGSGPLSVIELALSSRGEQDAFAEQVEFDAAVHLPFDHFDAVDGAFDGA
jgi:hypothetical protein